MDRMHGTASGPLRPGRELPGSSLSSGGLHAMREQGASSKLAAGGSKQLGLGGKLRKSGRERVTSVDSSNGSSSRANIGKNRRRLLLAIARIVRSVQHGAFINHMWGEAGTALSTCQMFLIRLFMIWPLQVITPAAYSYWAWQILQHIIAPPSAVRIVHATVQPAVVGPPQRWRPAQLLPALVGTMKWLGRETLRVWFAVEVMFYLYYRYKHWQLEGRSTHTPLLPPGETMIHLRKALETVELIQTGGKLAEPHMTYSRSMPLLQAWKEGHRMSPKPSAADLQSLLGKDNESGIEQLLRDWSDAKSAAGKVDFVPTAVTDSERLAAEQLVDEAEIITLKRAEACGWFMINPRRTERWPISRIGDLRRGNVLEWVAWAFWNSEVRDVPKDRLSELEELADEIIRWIELDVEPGYNPKASCMRLTMDPIPTAHRPLMYYAVTHAIFSQVINFQFRSNGFKPLFSGTLMYWHRQGKASAENGEAGAKEDMPIVFCHGIGVNLLPYKPFIDELLRRMPDRSFFFISLPHISMRIKEEVPSSSEMVACISDMLASWGFHKAHFVGHSFGSLPMAWMARKAPSFVGMMTFMDPVCFLLVKPDVCYNFMYREPSDPTQLLIHYFLARELYIAHSLSRNFFWHQNQLWPEECPCPTLVVLSGRDSIVPAHSVRRYLMAYKHKKNLHKLRQLWFPELGHGEINFGPVGEAACARIVSEMIVMEADFLGIGVATPATNGSGPPPAVKSLGLA